MTHMYIDKSLIIFIEPGSRYMAFIILYIITYILGSGEQH